MITVTSGTTLYWTYAYDFVSQNKKLPAMEGPDEK